MLEFFISHGPIFTYVGIMLALILTGAGLPIPEEIPVVAAAVLSSGSEPLLQVHFAYAACLFGAMVGDTLIYGIGRFMGTSFFLRHPRFAHLLHEEREKQMEDLIQRHGLKVFFLARFMVGIRAPVYLAAGALRVPFKKFLLVNSFSATIVVSVVFGLGYMFGEQISYVLRTYQTWASVAVAGVLIVAGLYYFWWRRPPSDGEGGDADRPTEQIEPIKQESVAADRSVA